MTRYEDVVQNQLGTVVAGATVTVRVQNATPGTGALATIYSDDGSTTIAGSAVTTDGLGRFSFYAPDGKYDLVVSGSGLTTYVYADVEITDALERFSTDSGWVVDTLSVGKANNVRIVDGSKFAATIVGIQAAIDDLPASGGMVFIPAGTYSGSSALVIDSSNVRLSGAGRHVTILQFTGATHGVHIDNAGGPLNRITLEHFTIETTNSGGLRGLSMGTTNESSLHTIRNVTVRANGAGEWQFGLWGNNWQSSEIYSLHLERSTDGTEGFNVGMRLENTANANSFYGLFIQGGAGGNATSRGIELNTVESANFFGGTWQAEFSGSILHSTASNPRVFGVHFENTDATPADGADIVIIGASDQAGLYNVFGPSLDVGTAAGTVRNFKIIGGVLLGVTFGANATLSGMYGAKASSITDNGVSTSGNIFLGNVTTGGGAYSNKLASVDLISPGVSPSSITPSSTAALLLANGTSLNARDTFGAEIQTYIPLSASNGQLFTYRVGGSIVWRNSVPTTKLTLDDSLLSTGSGVNLAIGTTPATSGALRLPNNTTITARNAANSANVDLLRLTTGDSTFLGPSGQVTVTSAGQVQLVPTTAQGVLVADGIKNNGSGFKHARVTTGSVTAGANTLVTITWGTAFADANYTPVVSVVETTAESPGLTVEKLESVAAGSITVRVKNNAAGSRTGTLQAIAVHD